MNLRERIEEALANPAGAGSRNIVDTLLAALEAGEVRAAERDANGTWNAVPWVKRGILLGFQVGLLILVVVPEQGIGERLVGIQRVDVRSGL